ncbi:MAG: exonuclease SbcCD subunit D [Candidatus Zixiibacteriota bacterium]|nr:MAG: exonuclease SbcCD subunit D [candidate division Zixibacteria bacterium]
MSDSHLGAGESHPARGPSGMTLRQEDIVNSFIEAVDAIISIKPDVCVHSGDLFHTARPTNRILATTGQQLYRLAVENGIPTVIIAGNHDAPRQAHVGAALDIFGHIDNLFIAARSKLRILDIKGARFFALPHCLTTAVQNEELTKCLPSHEAEYNILIVHGVAAGMPEFSMADLGEQEIPLEILQQFDYAALGHYHNHTRVSPRAFYAGSTERLSQSERDASKGFAVINMNPFEVEFRQVTTRNMVSLDTIDATGKRGDQLAEIIRDAVQQVDGSDKIVRLKVEGVTEETLKTMPADVITDLKQKSFSLDISFEKAASGEASIFGRSAIGRLDTGFLRFLETVDLQGFDIDKLKREALEYLADES